MQEPDGARSIFEQAGPLLTRVLDEKTNFIIFSHPFDVIILGVCGTMIFSLAFLGFGLLLFWFSEKKA